MSTLNIVLISLGSCSIVATLICLVLYFKLKTKNLNMNMNNGYSLEETKELEINSILKNTTNDKNLFTKNLVF